MTILVAKIGSYHGRGVYVGRPSPLGNPIPLLVEKDRAKVIAKYEIWLREKLENPDSSQSLMFQRLLQRSKQQQEDLMLLCFCHPKACHADIIKKILEEQ